MDSHELNQKIAETPQELRLRRLLQILALVYGVAVFAYLIPGLISPLKTVFTPPFVINSVAKIGTLALLSFFGSADVRRFRLLPLVLIGGNLLAEIASVCVLIWGATGYSIELFGHAFPVAQLIWTSIVFDGIATAILVWFWIGADRSRYQLFYLSPTQFRAAAALAEVVVVGKECLLTPETVAYNLDRYLAAFEASSKWITKLALTAIEIYPLLSLKPPFSYLSPDARLSFVKKRFYQDVTLRLVPRFWADLAQAMIRMGKQLCYLGYYNDPRTHHAVGYVPFSKRAPVEAAEARAEYLRQRIPLSVETVSDIDSDTISGDVVIVGSGAGASVLAEGLLRAGREVLMIERGDYVDPTQFSEDEADMLGRLYRDGALQLSRDFNFQVLQGSCVGGSTVINNAVCFDLPDRVLDRWNDPDSLDAGLDPHRLKSSFTFVRDLVGVITQDGKHLNKGARYFTDGIQSLQLELPPNEMKVVQANIQKCIGCGYCNIGCSYGKKMSMLDRVLPRLQQEYNRDGRKGLRIVAGCEAETVSASGKNVTAVECRLKDGRKIKVTGKTFVISAGAISSSLLLLRSRLGNRNVGRHVAFNAGSPMTGVFRNVVNSYDGLQISHYLELSPSRGYVLETWFNPPVAQALNMPGWFEDHFRNMRRYNRMTCAGILVGTESNAQVRIAGLTGREIDYVPTAEDFRKIIGGLVLSGEIFFKAGAESVMPSTFTYHEFHESGELKQMANLIKDASELTIGTGHPQGGNRISRNEQTGVIGPNFGVYGLDNLFVCDASVFPSSIGVNPQLTVMALAHYAAPIIAKG